MLVELLEDCKVDDLVECLVVEMGEKWASTAVGKKVERKVDLLDVMKVDSRVAMLVMLVDLLEDCKVDDLVECLVV